MSNETKASLATVASLAGAVLLSLGLLVYFATDAQSAVASFATVDVGCDEDLDQLINDDPRDISTTFVLDACTYEISEVARLKDHDHLVGPVGRRIDIAPARYAVPKAKLISTGADTIISMTGTDISVKWVEISGAVGRIDPNAPSSDCPASPLPTGCPIVGTGVGLAMGQADARAVVSDVHIHNNDAMGIGNAVGVVRRSHFHENTEVEAFEGVVGSAVKGIREFEAAKNYVHDEQANGIWLDHSESVRGNTMTGPGLFHHNYVADVERWSLRHEFAPKDAEEGQHLPTPSLLVEYNTVVRGGYQGTNRGGASIRDAQNSEWRFNEFIANAQMRAIVASDGGGNRTDLWDVYLHHNTLNGHTIRGCELPDNVVLCENNIP